MTDIHLAGIDLNSLEPGELKAYLIANEAGLYFPDLSIQLVKETDNIRKTGGSGGALPSGGIEGQLLVKQSAVNGDALWEDLILSGGGA